MMFLNWECPAIWGGPRRDCSGAAGSARPPPPPTGKMRRGKRRATARAGLPATAGRLSKPATASTRGPPPPASPSLESDPDRPTFFGYQRFVAELRPAGRRRTGCCGVASLRAMGKWGFAGDTSQGDLPPADGARSRSVRSSRRLMERSAAWADARYDTCVGRGGKGRRTMASSTPQRIGLSPDLAGRTGRQDDDLRRRRRCAGRAADLSRSAAPGARHEN